MVPGLEKLVDVVSSGVGSVAGPMLAPWRARREREARLIHAEGEAVVLSIQAQARAEARRLLVADRGLVTGEIELGDAIRQRIEFQERKRQANIVGSGRSGRVGTWGLKRAGSRAESRLDSEVLRRGSRRVV